MRSFLLASVALSLVGCGLVLDTSPPDPVDEGPAVVTPCTKDEECDDGVACTVDRCLLETDAGGPHGCYSVPRDELCPGTSSTASCARYVCAPRATWDSSGCAVAPVAGACDARHRCDLESFECEELPASCDDGCDDGNPCNGVETCADDPNDGCKRTTPGCNATAATCMREVCDTRSEVHACLADRKPVLACSASGP